MQSLAWAHGFLYVGAFTGEPPHTHGKATGINVFEVEAGSGALIHRQTLPDIPNPSFITMAPSGRCLYSVNANLEIDGSPGGSLSAFAVSPTDGTLAFLNRESVHSAGPCHVTIDRSGRWVASRRSGPHRAILHSPTTVPTFWSRIRGATQSLPSTSIRKLAG